MAALLLSFVGRRFWVMAYAMLALGLLLPVDLRGAGRFIPLALGGVLFFTCLKVRLTDVARELRSPSQRGRLALLVVMKLLLLPALTAALAALVDARWALGLLLLAAMPAGMSSAAFADVNGGNVPLALLNLLSTSLLAPLSVPLVLELGARLLGQGSPELRLDVLLGRATFIATMLLLPFAMAQLVRNRAPDWVAARQDWFTPAALSCLGLLIFVATGASRRAWLDLAGGTGLAAVVGVAWPLLLVTAACALFLLAGVATRALLTRDDAVAFASGAVYVNNGLAMAFALTFFPDRPEVLVPALLFTVPVVWMINWVGALLPAQHPLRSASVGARTDAQLVAGSSSKRRTASSSSEG